MGQQLFIYNSLTFKQDYSGKYWLGWNMNISQQYMGPVNGSAYLITSPVSLKLQPWIDPWFVSTVFTFYSASVANAFTNMFWSAESTNLRNLTLVLPNTYTGTNAEWVIIMQTILIMVGVIRNWEVVDTAKTSNANPLVTYFNA